MISIVRYTNKGTRVSRVGNSPYLQTAVLAGAKTPQMERFAKNIFRWGDLLMGLCKILTSMSPSLEILLHFIRANGV